MKKTVLYLLCLLLLLLLVSCKWTEEKTNVPTPAQTDDEALSETDDNGCDDDLLAEAKTEIELYERAIRGEFCVVDATLGEIKLKDCRFSTDGIKLGECEILYKAVLDMDGDGTNEFIIQSQEKDHIVLYCRDGRVYSYCFDSKSLYNLNTNGSFYWIDSNDLTNCTRGYSQIVLDGSSLGIKEIYRIKQTSPYDYGDGDHTYYVDGKELTRDAFLEYYDANCRRQTRAVFSPLDRSCEYPISSEKAFALAADYWNIENGMEDGAAGTIYVSRIVILEKPNDDTKRYRIAWQCEGYTNHTLDSCYSQPPKSVHIHQELYVDAITGECVKIDGKG